jgi:hypothetical protein
MKRELSPWVGGVGVCICRAAKSYSRAYYFSLKANKKAKFALHHAMKAYKVLKRQGSRIL